MISEPNIAISVRNIQKTFDGRKVLEDIDLRIVNGEIFVIMGGSGSGKSTLLRIMTGGLKPDGGKVYFGDKAINDLNAAQSETIKRRFAMSFQSAALLDSLTVEQNVSLPLREHTSLTPKVIGIIAKMKLNLVGLQGFESYFPSMLSGGMKKRAGIARAIVMDPEIIFYDEPTAGLDPVMCAVIDKLIVDLARKLNLTSVVVTHNMESVFRIADRAAMLYKGKLLEIGTREQIKNSRNPIVRQFINGDIQGPIQIS